MIIDLDDLAIALGEKLDICDLVLKQCSLDASKSILEAGCGTGKLSLNLVFRTKAMAVLVDNDPGAIRIALRNLQAVEALAEARFPVVIRREDITRLPYPDRSFDLVFNEGVIEHFKDPVAVLKEMARVSRGTVIAFVPNAENAKQQLLARRQTQAYAGKEHWAAYEVPMQMNELRGYMAKAGLQEVKGGYVWRDSTEPEDNPSQYRLVVGVGRV